MAEPMDIDSTSTEDSTAMANFEQSMNQPRCPYRMSGISSSSISPFRPSNSQHPAFHHPPLPIPSPLTPYNYPSNQLLPNPTWNYPSSHQPLQSTYNSTSNNRYPSHNQHHSNQGGRARELAYFDHYHTQGDGRQQSHPPVQRQQIPFHEPRSLFQPQIPSQSTAAMSAQGSGAAGESSAPTNRFSVPPVASSNFNTGFPRPDRSNGNNGSNPGSPNSITPSQAADQQQGWGVPQNRQLPPPNSIYDPYRLMQGMYSSREPSRGTSSSTRPSGSSGQFLSEIERQERAHLPPPRLPRERTMTSSATQHVSRDWHQETAYVDFDSDDSLEDTPSPPRHVHPVYRHALYEQEERLERERAARRAQAAAVKFVASASALASFEKVDSKTLSEDERSCIICYNEFGVMNPDGHIECAVRLPKCKHVFGDHCIKQWLKDSDSCPYCRDKLPSEPKQVPGSVASQRENLRRFLADGRHARMLNQLPNSQWDMEAGPERDAYEAAITSATQQGRPNAYDQDQLALQGHEMLAILRREASDADYMHRSISEHEGGRNRRTRGRHSMGRISTQNASIRPSGSATARVRLNHPQPPMRNPIQSSQSFDGGSTSQQRSITPHPAGLPAWATNTLANQPTSSGRPSSLPNERSPLGQASENAQSTTVPDSTNNTATASRPTSFNEDVRSTPRVTPPQPQGWTATTTANGRPASAEYLHELSQSRQMEFGDMNWSFGSFNPSANRNQNSSNQQLPQPQPTHQDNEFHQQFPQPNFWHPRYPGGQ